ncbi:hypothetical protein LEP1GSC098_0988 [Leptospira interrogans serovar Grippotyphosa str. UI 08434]|nr:hypothetical protein LEP1GSC098_0988 [Leptospira interrogans serovar Grippotyphosa str. UI 08434]EMN82483.1 hypothetical protein LEP1GSC106_4971 [Leptospira interrogans serovar Grippotyphosa str. UI 12764]
MNKILFFGKVVVPTFYLFARLVRNNLGQNKSSLHSKPPNDIKVIFRKCRLMKFAVTDSAQRLTASRFL